MMDGALRVTLKALRQDAGLSLETLAERLAAVRKGTISHTTIYRLETGASAGPRDGWDVLVADYAAVFGTTPDSIWRDAITRYMGHR